MHNNDLDEDFPLNGGSDKLDRLFEENSLPDISFKFAGTKPPVPRSKPSQNNIPLKVVFAKTVEAFQMKVAGYKSEGKVGIAIIGNDEHCYYQLYMYKNDEKKVGSAEVTFQFAFLVQQYNYASFKDSHNIQWSVHFDKSSDLISFSKEITLARWRSCQGSRQKLVQESFKGNPDLTAKSTDIIRVSYSVYSLSPESILNEEECKKRTLTGPAGGKTWETSLVGACVKSKRFVVLPAQLSASIHLSLNVPLILLQDKTLHTPDKLELVTSLNVSLPEGYHLFLELEIEDITPPPASDTVSNTPSTTSSEKKEEVESLPGRMAKIGYALPSLQASDTDSTRTVSNSSSLSLPSVNSTPRQKEDLSAMIEPCDVSTTSQFNVLFSEVRTSNSEIRMNINRVTDKVDSLLSKMDFVPQINHEVIPTLKKFQNIDSILNKIVDQNSAISILLEKNSPTKLESTVNEVLQLKKRNAELEQFLEVTQSTSQILKDKVVELTEKTTLLGDVCSSCNGGKKVQSLEESVRSLQERNYSLLEVTDLLRNQNQELNTKLSLLQRETSEKDIKLVELMEEVSNLNMKLENVSLERRNENGDDVIKSLINKIYKSLKENLKDLTSDKRLEKTLSTTLLEVSKAYLCSGDGLPQEEACQSSKVYNKNQAPPGNLPFSPSDTPLPIPRPRKPQPPPTYSSLGSHRSSLSIDDSFEKPLQNHDELAEASEKNYYSCSNKDCSDEESSLLESSTLNSSQGDKFFVTPSKIPISDLVSTPEPESKLSKSTSQVKSGISTLESATQSKNNTFLEKATESKKNTTSEVVSAQSKSNTSHYISPYYTPLFPNTPPPITDDGSDMFEVE